MQIMKLLKRLKHQVKRTKEKKTRLAAESESQMREVARLGQSLVIMELS